jgi:RHS repeat-associated protein
MGPGYTKVTRIYGDRLGSTRGTYTTDPYYPLSWTTRNYYPFGEEIGTVSANNQYKYASTYRDAVWDGSQWVATGLDYAINRYYASGTARFTTPDPYQASGGPAVPQNWNRYSYVHNDPVNFRDPWGLLEAAPDGFCPAEYHDCGGWGWLGGGWSWEGAGVRSGGAPDPLSVATGNVLNQFPGLPFADAQTLARILLAGGSIGICVGGGVCEVVAAAAAGAAVGVTVGYLIKLGMDWIYATKADIKQVQDAARTVSREPGCRPPTPDDYEKVHEIIKGQKGPDGKVPYSVLLDAWRQVLCE